MKKLLLFLLLSFIINIGYSQQDSTSYVTNSNVEKLVDKYSTKLEASITALAKELKQPAEHVYKILVKQQIVLSFSYLLIFLLTIGLIIGFIPFMRYGLKGDTQYQYYSSNFGKYDGLVGLAVFWGILIIVGLSASVILLPDILQGFLNPEYGAIKDIISFFK